MGRHHVLGVSLIVAGLVTAGCASTPERPSEMVQGELANAPEWVRKNCSAYWKEKDERQICGIGSMGGTRNAALARSTAVARARTEIARTLSVQVESMLKDYQATTTGGANFGSAADDAQHVTDVSRQITDHVLAGTELIDSWISDSGTFYALVALDAARFKDAISKMSQLSEAVRNAVVERADDAFRDLDRQLEKRE